MANLFPHYAFDKWMERHYPKVLFERYADNVICHCGSEAQTQALLADLKIRMEQCQLGMHSEKTQVVYCVDANRRGDFAVKRFDFLGYTFEPRRAKRRTGTGDLFTSLSLATSDKAAKAMRNEMRNWGLSRVSRYDLGDLLARIRLKIKGWVRFPCASHQPLYRGRHNARYWS